MGPFLQKYSHTEKNPIIRACPSFSNFTEIRQDLRGQGFHASQLPPQGEEPSACGRTLNQHGNSELSHSIAPL